MAVSGRLFSLANTKKLALVLLALLLLVGIVGTTVSFIITGTPSLLNVFTSGLTPSGDLTIRKALEHPFGSGYAVPGDLEFSFTVELGESWAGKTLETSQGSLTADQAGRITVTVKPGGAVRIRGIDEHTAVTVTENLPAGFAVEGENPKTVTITRDTTELLFTNVYTPAPVPEVNLTVNGLKTLEGRDWQEGDSFTFLLEYRRAGSQEGWQALGTAAVTYELVEAPDPEDPEKTILVPKPDFDKFSFTELVRSVEYPTAGTWSFRVSEVEGTIGGITYDKVVTYFDVTVGDADMDGYLEIQAVSGGQNAVTGVDEMGNFTVDLTVNNVYAPEGSETVFIKIQKTVTSWSGEEKSWAGYTFDLFDENGQLIATSAPTSAAGEAYLELSYDAADAGKSFHYVLKETGAGQTVDGMTYDSGEYHVTVTVVDDLDGTISAYVYDTIPAEPAPTPTEPTEEATEPTEETTEVTEETTEPTEETTEATEPAEEIPESVQIPEGASDVYEALFENVYDPVNTAVSFDGTKTLTGRSLREGEFTFQLYETGPDFAITDGMTPIRTASNTAEGSFRFDPVEFNRVGTYWFVVKEEASGLPGVAYDDARYLVTVTVTDTNGILTAAVSIADELGAPASIAFVNAYTPAPVSRIFSGLKVLEGAELREEMFRFKLYETDSTFTVQGAALSTVTNDADGSFAFDSIEYTTEGTHYYVILEDAGSLANITYDESRYGITVQVWDNGDGQLVSSAAITLIGGDAVDSIVFTNTYVEKETTEPTEETTEPTEETTEPMEETTEPTEETTAPTEETTVPTEETTEPEDTVPSAEPTTPTTKPPSPGGNAGTGDDSLISLYLALMALSLCAAALLLACPRRKGSNKR